MSTAVFKKRGYSIPVASTNKKVEIPEGLWTKCPSCGEVIYNQKLDENLRVCPLCEHHFPMSVQGRIASLLDEGSFVESDVEMKAVNTLHFPNYAERVEKERVKTKVADALTAGMGRLEGIPVSLALMNFEFLGGSMGVVVGEKITRAAERALEHKSPLIILSASGGARMHEGCFSLMQMAKVSALLLELSRARLPFISLLTNPTMGGVSASYATLGDVILAEPGAMIGFAGPRVIKETTHQDLPKGFQTAEFLLTHGLIDQIVHRKQLKSSLASILRFLQKPAA